MTALVRSCARFGGKVSLGALQPRSVYIFCVEISSTMRRKPLFSQKRYTKIYKDIHKSAISGAWRARPQVKSEPKNWAFSFILTAEKFGERHRNGLVRWRSPGRRRRGAHCAAGVKGGIMACKYTNEKKVDYFLHVRRVQLRHGDTQTIYFFSEQAHEGLALEEIPEGFVVFESNNKIPHLEPEYSNRLLPSPPPLVARKMA